MKRIPLLPGCVVRVSYLYESESPYDHHTHLTYVTQRFAVLEVETDYYLLIPLDWKSKNPVRMDKWRIEYMEIESRPSWCTDELAQRIMESVPSDANK